MPPRCPGGSSFGPDVKWQLTSHLYHLNMSMMLHEPYGGILRVLNRSCLFISYVKTSRIWIDDTYQLRVRDRDAEAIEWDQGSERAFDSTCCGRRVPGKTSWFVLRDAPVMTGRARRSHLKGTLIRLKGIRSTKAYTRRRKSWLVI